MIMKIKVGDSIIEQTIIMAGRISGLCSKIASDAHRVRFDLKTLEELHTLINNADNISEAYQKEWKIQREEELRIYQQKFNPNKKTNGK